MRHPTLPYPSSRKAQRACQVAFRILARLLRVGRRFGVVARKVPLLPLGTLSALLWLSSALQARRPCQICPPEPPENGTTNFFYKVEGAAGCGDFESGSWACGTNYWMERWEETGVDYTNWIPLYFFGYNESDIDIGQQINWVVCIGGGQTNSYGRTNGFGAIVSVRITNDNLVMTAGVGYDTESGLFNRSSIPVSSLSNGFLGFGANELFCDAGKESYNVNLLCDVAVKVVVTFP